MENVSVDRRSDPEFRDFFISFVVIKFLLIVSVFWLAIDWRKFFAEEMGKKKVMLPADEVDLATVKYQYDKIEGVVSFRLLAFLSN